jgi:hypothetical protein
MDAEEADAGGAAQQRDEALARFAIVFHDGNRDGHLIAL